MNASFTSWAALLCALLIAVLTVGAALATPDYSHLAQFISELGERGARFEHAVRFVGFLPAGLLMLAYCYGAWRALPRAGLTTVCFIGLALYAMGYVVSAFVPCDPGCRPAEPSLAQTIHNAVGMAGYIAAPWALFTLASQARKWPGAYSLVWLGYAAGALALAGLLTLHPESPFAGLSQRALEAAVLTWAVASGLYLRRRVSA